MSPTAPGPRLVAVTVDYETEQDSVSRRPSASRSTVRGQGHALGCIQVVEEPAQSLLDSRPCRSRSSRVLERRGGPERLGCNQTMQVRVSFGRSGSGAISQNGWHGRARLKGAARGLSRRASRRRGRPTSAGLKRGLPHELSYRPLTEHLRRRATPGTAPATVGTMPPIGSSGLSGSPFLASRSNDAVLARFDAALDQGIVTLPGTPELASQPLRSSSSNARCSVRGLTCSCFAMSQSCARGAIPRKVRAVDTSWRRASAVAGRLGTDHVLPPRRTPQRGAGVGVNMAPCVVLALNVSFLKFQHFGHTRCHSSAPYARHLG